MIAAYSVGYSRNRQSVVWRQDRAPPTTDVYSRTRVAIIMSLDSSSSVGNVPDVLGNTISAGFGQPCSDDGVEGQPCSDDVSIRTAVY
jgi:hypothetical protein